MLLSSRVHRVQGEMKLQIDRMIAKFFSSLPVDEQLNFSVAVTVMSVQRKWRQRMKAHKVGFRHCIPAWSSVLYAQLRVMRYHVNGHGLVHQIGHS